MEKKQTIKVGYDAQTGMYTFQVNAPYNSKVEVNGKSLVNPLTGAFKNGDLYVTSEKPETITYTSSARNVVAYLNTETEQQISIEAYRALQNEVNSSRTYNDDTDEYEYASIEAEVAAVRFSRSYNPVYEDQVTIHEYEIEMIEYPVSAYSNIVPLYSLDAKNIFETKCKYMPNNMTLFYEVCEKYGIDKERINMPTHSGLRFVIIDDSYLTGAEDFEKSMFANQTIGTYEECIARLNGARKLLDDMVSMHLAKNSKKVLDKGTVGELLKELLTLKSQVSRLDVKQKEYNSQRSIVAKTNELIETYKQLA
jgi:hypothetical protein